HVTNVDGTSARDLTRATIEGRRQAWHAIDVYRKYVPGMENCYMVSTPNTVGVRESRRILGEYVLTEDDITQQREFEDNICYGAFFIDVHNIDGPGMDATVWRPPEGFKYHIPYRCLVPLEVDNLLTAGRCISVSHLALGSTRVMVQCIGTGEAAGVAAALSLDGGMTPRELDAGRVQSALRERGAILTEEDIQRAG
ncbi:MAG: FAD-dependent oxidoreductase, partial [Candidatus Brocadiaceae bacterium]